MALGLLYEKLQHLRQALKYFRLAGFSLGMARVYQVTGTAGFSHLLCRWIAEGIKAIKNPVMIMAAAKILGKEYQSIRPCKKQQLPQSYILQ